MLKPDYSLSFSHFCIGLFAHLITHEKRFWFLGSAGLAMNSRQHLICKLPSWVPECRDDSMWREMFQEAPAELVSSGSQLHHAPFQLYRDAANRLQSNNNDHGDDAISWPSDTIDPASGAIIMSAAHIFSFKDGVTAQGRYGPLCRYAIVRQDSQGLPVPSRLILVIPQNVEIQPTRDHLYIPVSMPNVYLILRRTSHTSTIASFELVTACARLFGLTRPPELFELYFLAKEEHSNAEDWSTIGMVPSIAGLQMTLGVEVRLFRWQLRDWSRHAPYNSMGSYVMPEILTWRYVDPKFNFFVLWSLWDSSPSLLPGEEHDFLHSILALCIAIHKDEDEMTKAPEQPANRHLEDEYLECLNGKFFHRVGEFGGETHIEYALDINSWYDWRCEDFYDIARLSSSKKNNSWIWRRNDEDVWHQAPYPSRAFTESRASASFMFRVLRDAEFRRPQGGHFVLRISLHCVTSYLRNLLNRAQQILRRIVCAYDKPPDIEVLADLIRNGTETEQESTGMGCYMADVKTDGRVSQVRIL